MTDKLVIPQIDHLEIEDRRKHEAVGVEEIEEYRAYLAGEQPSMLDLKQSSLLKSRDDHSSTANILKLIIQSTASRLRLQGWEVQDPSAPDTFSGIVVPRGSVEQLSTFLDDIWLRNQMKRLQYRTVVATLRDGNSVIMLECRDNQIKYWLEPWWDGRSGTFVFYKNTDTYDYAVKDFKLRVSRSETVERRNVYLEGMIARFVRKGTGWAEWSTPEMPAYEPLVRRDGRPLAIPVVHFQNDSDDLSPVYGVSELTGLLGLQDDLNALQSDISTVGYLTAFQRLFVFGASVPAGDIKTSPGGVIGVPGDGSLQVIPPGDANGLLSIDEAKKQAIATVSRTPMHSITGQWPSGAALLQADLPKIDQVEMLAELMGPRYTLLAHRSTEYMNAYGTTSDLNEDIPITSVFAPAQRIDELTDLEIRKKKADLWTTLSNLTLPAMIEAGVDPEVAKKIHEAKSQEVPFQDFGL